MGGDPLGGALGPILEESGVVLVAVPAEAGVYTDALKGSDQRQRADLRGIGLCQGLRGREQQRYQAHKENNTKQARDSHKHTHSYRALIAGLLSPTGVIE